VSIEKRLKKEDVKLTGEIRHHFGLAKAASPLRAAIADDRRKQFHLGETESFAERRRFHTIATRGCRVEIGLTPENPARN
jgi:hypothetical protein